MGKTGRAAAAGAAWRLYRDAKRPGSASLSARIRALPRMVRQTLGGDYRGLGKGKLGLMALSVVYIVSPIDILPELLPLIGVVDDVGVLVWLLGSALGESDRFVRWEKSRIAGEVVP
ncbi:YkvA family protein [Rhizohabitans arisaemae]|uniref:YkvA family protein n=1 Tax=Rhizohabitans arisaemae TaxID=2720610 RepID=UPI0024B0EF9F|nr:YkvA family protein [Rhizohabitans arisaemae]